ncbi:MAG: glycoside hydrolase family 43 protein [Proteiniphilum sp.]
MKHTLLLSVAVLYLLMSACSPTGEKEFFLFTSFHEPANEGLRYLYSEDGYQWDSIPGIFLKPELGKQLLMRDPSIVKGPDDSYHLVWTTSWKGDLGFGHAQSKDLIHWSAQQMIPAMTDTTTVNVWAPEIFYDDVNDQYIIVWASCVPGKFENGAEDEDNNHRLYYLTTKDFETFSETKLFLDPGFSVIDATIVKRSADDYVLVLKDNTRPNRNLKVAFAKSPVGPYSNVSDSFTGEFIEGPTVTRVGENYLIYFDMYREKIYGAMKTSDFINFVDVTDEIQIPNGHKHGTITKVSASIVEGLKRHSIN